MERDDPRGHREHRSFLSQSASRAIQNNDLKSARTSLHHLLNITALNRDGDDPVFFTMAQYQLAQVEEKLGHSIVARDLCAQAFHTSVLREFWRYQIAIVQNWARFEHQAGSPIIGCRLYQLAVLLHIGFLDMEDQPKDEIGMEEELIDMHREFTQMGCDCDEH